MEMEHVQFLENVETAMKIQNGVTSAKLALRNAAMALLGGIHVVKWR